MSSILAVLDLAADDDLGELRNAALSRSALQRHRGPDWTEVHASNTAVVVQEGLEVVEALGERPLLHCPDCRLTLALDGHLTNSGSLRSLLEEGCSCQSGSGILRGLFQQLDSEFPARLNGSFAFVLHDAGSGRHLIGRDPVGMAPLYWGHDHSGRLWVASEMKALAESCPDVAVFPPGHVYDSISGLRPFHQRSWQQALPRASKPVLKRLRQALEQAVQHQLPEDHRWGVLLSGGLDSSLVAACAAELKRQQHGSQARVPSFAVGLEGSPDLEAAAAAAKALGTEHHAITYTVEEGLDVLPEVIRHIESYDVTTVRSSIPMFLMARRIRALGLRMVLSGEGSDELFGGYLYFHKAPSAQAFHEETVRKLHGLHHYDCLRANKSMLAWGVETRLPFLDQDFVDLAMTLDVAAKMPSEERMEKHLLRQAFDGALPDHILWRRKEQFSDGVGYGWIDALKAHAETLVSRRQLQTASSRFPVNSPQTHEALLYREIFERFYPGQACALTVPWEDSIACSSAAALAWDPSFAAMADPSGRALIGLHKAVAVGGAA